MIDYERFDEMRRRAQERLKPSRYLHSVGVSQTAEQLARIYGVNENDAAVAGLLHDWDKALSFEELRRQAKKRKLASKEVRKHMPGVLHSYTAAATLRKEFPELSDEVLQAIARHTCAAKDMTDLDMVLFVADIVEPNRTYPGVRELREAVGRVSLDELYYRTYQQSMLYLLQSGMALHPDSLDIWNDLVKRRAKAQRKEARAVALAALEVEGCADESASRGPRRIVIE